MTTQATWYHAHLDAVSRSEGNSAVGLASYMTGEPLKDERTGKWCTRNHPGEVMDWGTVIPKGAPQWLAQDENLGKAWNAVEAAEKRKDSHVANHWNIASSREFSPADHVEVAKKMAQAISDKYGVMVTWAIHAPTDHGDNRNWHIHLGYSMRRVGPDGFGEKAREIAVLQTRIEHTIWQRKLIADTLNERLELIGSEERVSHESYKKLGVSKEPTRHRGNEANQLELKGVSTEVGDHNREVQQRNAEREEAQRRILNLQSEIVYIESTQRKKPMDAEQLSTRDLYEEHVASLETIIANKQRAEEVARDFEIRKNEADRKEKELAEEAQRRREPDAIDDAQARAQRAARLFDGTDESMLRVIGAEYDDYRASQDRLKEQIVAETDPEKRKLLQLRHDIQHAEYEEIVQQREAGFSYAITGQRGMIDVINEEGYGAQEKSRHQIHVDLAKWWGAKVDVMRDDYAEQLQALRERAQQEQKGPIYQPGVHVRANMKTGEKEVHEAGEWPGSPADRYDRTVADTIAEQHDLRDRRDSQEARAHPYQPAETRPLSPAEQHEAQWQEFKESVTWANLRPDQQERMQEQHHRMQSATAEHDEFTDSKAAKLAALKDRSDATEADIAHSRGRGGGNSL